MATTYKGLSLVVVASTRQIPPPQSKCPHAQASFKLHGILTAFHQATMVVMRNTRLIFTDPHLPSSSPSHASDDALQRCSCISLYKRILPTNFSVSFLSLLAEAVSFIY